MTAVATWRLRVALLLIATVAAGTLTATLFAQHVHAAGEQGDTPRGGVGQFKVTSLRFRQPVADFSQADMKDKTINQEADPQIPVIGVLTQVLRDYKRFTNTQHLHIAASYIKWIEGAGAQAMPILLGQDDAYYEQMFRQTNGLLLPGGDNLLDPKKNTPMMVAAKKLYKLAVDANNRGDFYPIWGTCLGLELLSVLSSNRNVLEQCSATDIALPVDFVARGKLFAASEYDDLAELGHDYPKVIVDLLAKRNITYNYHHKCLTDEGLERANLTNFYRPLAYSLDKNNFKFIAIFEAIEYPFYGVQFHPEKAPYEFQRLASQTNTPHSVQSIAVTRYFSDFFINQARKSNHRPRLSDIEYKLIYAFQPTYTAPKRDLYEQRYLFPFPKADQNDSSISLEEFLDFIPASDDEVPEDVAGDQDEVEEENREEETTIMRIFSPLMGAGLDSSPALLGQALQVVRRKSVVHRRHPTQPLRRSSQSK